MANKIRTPLSTGHVSVLAIIETANLKKGDYVNITGDETVDLIDAEADIPVGFVVVPARAADGKGTVQTRYQYKVNKKCNGAIAAGDFVMNGATVATVQTFKKWTAGVDNPSLIVGQCWVGAGDTAEGEFLIF